MSLVSLDYCFTIYIKINYWNILFVAKILLKNNWIMVVEIRAFVSEL
jgi:hypothetical protein